MITHHYVGEHSLSVNELIIKIHDQNRKTRAIDCHGDASICLKISWHIFRVPLRVRVCYSINSCNLSRCYEKLSLQGVLIKSGLYFNIAAIYILC